MRLNHLDLAVSDVSLTRAFFEKYFGFRCVFERGRDTIAVLLGESGFILTLSNFDKVDRVEYPNGFHIGFMQDSRERVDEIYRRLTSDGINAEPPREFHGAWTFYFRAPGDFVVEIFHQHMQGGNRSS
jgi:catechol 2,3-dioxygenase-like lactoylglutathione lyase family enzyme